MTTWPDPERLLIARYLAGLGLRSPNSRTYYKQALHSFQDVAERHAELGKDVLVAWLRASLRSLGSDDACCTAPASSTGSLITFCKPARSTTIPSSPCARHAISSNASRSGELWRPAIPESALAELRQPKPFGSVLGDIMAEHVALMRNRGYKYTTQPVWLLRFDRFLQLNPALQDEPIGVMLEHWAAAKTTRNHAAECEKLKRVLAKILRHRDPSIPPRRPDSRPEKEVAKQWRKPHIYSPADVRQMLDIARSYPSPRAPLRPLSIYTMLLLAYCAGLRRGELARLDLGDVDLQGGTITVRQTKFFKTRILPLTRQRDGRASGLYRCTAPCRRIAGPALRPVLARAAQCPLHEGGRRLAAR